MSEERNTNPRTRAVWFEGSPELEACFHEAISIAVEHGWHCAVTPTGIEVRRPGSRTRLTILTARALQDAPRRALASFRELCKQEATAQPAADQADFPGPAAGRGVVVGAYPGEYSRFSGSHISERSG